MLRWNEWSIVRLDVRVVGPHGVREARDRRRLSQASRYWEDAMAGARESFRCCPKYAGPVPPPPRRRSSFPRPFATLFFHFLFPASRTTDLY
jgi:hypothetical protein